MLSWNGTPIGSLDFRSFGNDEFKALLDQGTELGESLQLWKAAYDLRKKLQSYSGTYRTKFSNSDQRTNLREWFSAGYSDLLLQEEGQDESPASGLLLDQKGLRTNRIAEAKQSALAKLARELVFDHYCFCASYLAVAKAPMVVKFWDGFFDKCLSDCCKGHPVTDEYIKAIKEGVLLSPCIENALVEEFKSKSSRRCEATTLYSPTGPQDGDSIQTPSQNTNEGNLAKKRKHAIEAVSPQIEGIEFPPSTLIVKLIRVCL